MNTASSLARRSVESTWLRMAARSGLCSCSRTIRPGMVKNGTAQWAFSGAGNSRSVHTPGTMNVTSGQPTSHRDNSHQQIRMIMFGKPGAGKGTLSARLVRKYDILSLSTGDLLRQHIAERTELGQLAEQSMSALIMYSTKIVTVPQPLLKVVYWVTRSC
jgi:nucleoside-triphosphate--adenylate kinase